MRLPKGIYGITDDSYNVKNHVDAAKVFLEGGVRIIQYRRKEGSIRQMLNEAKEIRKLCNQYGAVMIVDDRVDIAVLSDADGVHVGLEDAPVDEVKRRFSGIIIGASASTVDEAKEGEKAGADYLGAGSIFPSPTKPDYRILGLEGLRRVVQSVSIPVYAIGGVTLESIPAIKATGAWGAAVISGILAAKDPLEMAKRFVKAWDEA
ncbi:thiamine phosphate synthase [Caldivirga maquilingensis]|uniref:Thiamine-phosphate synthase n=1 Tax=Caldivirga maquilingensis (strain ATCC 700844 / DSM 13496 / JCM 10307 / IC-167) TaxID=397948 RepID=THIE_CALMQ|nr:thiamine phosphate synthase [Caldivirga maquilingensis]A8M9N4.1 RecName: Full=Thiamine-phosphate synthase; Short=TP synthase; Short=TPS; AltName: Full=Thiamine-phosphate pyrophosphorylase; Short=TMP pyrophosphorylase; Short=TMP-PPase [Caldivirga maquilingensis IC-167]ABW00915.1 thiamine-phosphate pyrophosphorylase [Caldivirga maquilingensis IC-167]